MAYKLAIYTEAEAGRRRCPIATGDGFHETRCVASECMAWRWAHTHIDDPAGGADLVPDGQTYGYCGLAGSPNCWRS